MACKAVWLLLSLLAVLEVQSETTEMTADTATVTASTPSLTSGGIDLTCTGNGTSTECRGGSETTETTADTATVTASTPFLTSGGIDLTCTVNGTSMECRGEQMETPVLPFVRKKLSQAAHSGTSLTALSLAIKSLGSLENNSLILHGVQELSIVRSDLSSVLQGAFTQAKASLHTLDLSQNNLTTVPSTALQDLPSLTALNLSYNQITELNGYSFKNISSLTVLSLRGNEISSVAVGAFFHLERLKDLDLSSNKLTSFDSSAFGKTALETLRLASNSLKSVSLERSLTQLRHVDLSHNQISSATMKLDLPGLITLNIGHNSLTELKLDSLASLQTLTVAHNPVKRLTKSSLAPLLKLETLDASHCQLRRLEELLFSTLGKLKLLNMSANNIYTADSAAFVGLNSLVTLDLSRNEITYINQNHTADLASLEHIDLSGNSIEYIFAGAFAHSPNIRSINLQGNSLDCGCQLQGFANLLKHREFAEETLSSAVCDDDSHIVDYDFGLLVCTTEKTPVTGTTIAATMASETTAKPLTIQSTPVAGTTTVETTASETTTAKPHTTQSTPVAGTTIVATTASETTTVKPHTIQSTPVAGTTIVATMASEATTAKPHTTQNPTTMVPFNGRLTLVHMEQDNTKLSLTWNAYSGSDPLDQLQCRVTVRAIGQTFLTNVTQPCSPAYRNKTFHIFVTKLGVKYEVCLLAYRHAAEVARNCNIFNTTKVLPTTPLVMKTAGETTVATFSKRPAETTTHEEISTISQDDQDDKFHYRLRIQPDLSVPRQLRVNWSFTPPFHGSSPCRLNVTVLKNKSTLMRVETACSSGGHLTVGNIARENDYDVCFSRLVLNITADCHEISFPELAYSHGPATGASSSSAAGNRDESRPPVALLIMIAALVLIAVLAVLLFIHRRLRKRAIARRKVKDSVFHLQLNRRSGTYQVQDATEARTTLSSSVSHDGTTTKMSQRASSIDEL
ncbi:uncharacterized protein LOC144170437 isoform X1 [Haemaphysalis longicornis]